MAIAPYLRKRALYDRLIFTEPEPDLAAVVVIPAYNEPGLLEAVQHLANIDRIDRAVEIFVILNHPETAERTVRQMHFKQYEVLRQFNKADSSNILRIYPILLEDLPEKISGVGLARKVGMDEAARRLAAVGADSGIIACYDADCRCSANYFHSLIDFFQNNPTINACSITFEHSTEGLNPDEKKAIQIYELHLRYFIEAQRYAGFPFAFHTVGSSMAVRAGAYASVGGMNRRKAGEDFYFLQKCIERGNFGELTSAKIYPSARKSERVPFGTGRAMNDILVHGRLWTTYPLEGFIELRALFISVESLYQAELKSVLEALNLSPVLRLFLKDQGIEKKLCELRQNTASSGNFRKRFFHWFNAFQLMKYLHYRREVTGESGDTVEEAARLNALRYMESAIANSPGNWLDIYRQLQSVPWRGPI